MIRNSLGSSILDPKNDYRLTSWCLQQEDQNKITLYQCDVQFTTWTQRCVRQADCILIVGLADKEPTVGKVGVAKKKKNSIHYFIYDYHNTN